MLNLEQLRIELDEIDEQVFELLDRRFEISKEVGKYKAKHNIPVLNETRENEIISKILSENNAYEITEIYKLIFILSKRVQK